MLKNTCLFFFYFAIVDPACINTNINDTSNRSTKENIEEIIDYNDIKWYVFCGFFLNKNIYHNEFHTKLSYEF